MECWVLSDHQHLVEPVCVALQQLNLRCPESHRISLSSAARSPLFSESVGGTAFIATPRVSDDEISLIRRLRSISAIHLVLVSSVADSTSVVNAIRAGASDYLDMDHDLQAEISSCLGRIKRAEADTKLKSHTISTVPCHVSSDGSVLGTNLAAAIAKKHGKCCLLDFQLRGGDVAILLQMQPRHSIYDLISQSTAVDETMFRQALSVHESGIHVLSGPKLFSDLRGIDPQSCNAIVEHAQATFPYVVICTEDIQHSEQLFALAHSDRVVVTMRPDILSLHRAKAHVDLMLANGINEAHIQIAVMAIGLPGELPMTAIKKVFSRTTVHGLPDDAATLMLSVNLGNPVVLESPKSPSARQIQSLADSLTGHDSEKPSKSFEHYFGARAAALLALNTLPFCK